MQDEWLGMQGVRDVRQKAMGQWVSRNKEASLERSKQHIKGKRSGLQGGAAYHGGEGESMTPLLPSWDDGVTLKKTDSTEEELIWKRMREYIDSDKNKKHMKLEP